MSKLNIYAFLLLLLSSCSEAPTDYVFSAKDSPHNIIEDIEIPEGKKLIVEPGAELIIADGINIISFGDVSIEGTESQPIHIKGTSRVPGWGQLKLKGEAKKFTIKHATIEDGTLTSFQTNNHFDRVKFVNKQDLNWEWAIARFWYGQVLIENCISEGTNKAEGFLLHDVNEAIVRNCRFDTVPDGVEYISCVNGEILNNYFYDGNDDAIDLNGCNNTKITGNKIYRYANGGMELGSENFGRSTDLVVNHNYIENCNIGIILKDASTANFGQDTLVNNKVGFELSTPKDSTDLTVATLTACIYDSNDTPIQKDERSKVNIN